MSGQYVAIALYKPERGRSGDGTQETDMSRYTMSEVQAALQKLRRLDNMQDDIQQTLAFLRESLLNVLQELGRSIQIPSVAAAGCIPCTIVFRRVLNYSDAFLIINVDSLKGSHVLYDTQGYHPLNRGLTYVVWRTLPALFDLASSDKHLTLIGTLDFLDSVPDA